MTKQQLIWQHLEGWRKVNIASVKNYAETGKISGTLLTSIKEMMQQYADQQCEKQREICAASISRFQFNSDINSLILNAPKPNEV